MGHANSIKFEVYLGSLFGLKPNHTVALKVLSHFSQTEVVDAACWLCQPQAAWFIS